MLVNADKPNRWKEDVQASVAFFNHWFVNSAPKVYRDSRVLATIEVKNAMQHSNDFREISPATIREYPGIVPVLRMAMAPPIARDRLIGLSGTKASLQKSLESGILPSRMSDAALDSNLTLLCDVLNGLLDLDLFPWIAKNSTTNDYERELAAVVVADRLCGAQADPIVRNAQERRQLAAIESWLIAHDYTKGVHAANRPLTEMESGTFAFRMNVSVANGQSRRVNIPVDVVVQPKKSMSGGFPMMIEAKSAGDFTNTNKRRKEEAQKVRQLRETYGASVSMLLFLCGYFDTPYLGYEAAEGLDWVWEHRIDDLAIAGL